MRLLPALLAGIFLAFGPAASALGLKVEKLAFIPAIFYSGEEVEAFALVSFDGGLAPPEPFELKAGEGLPLPSAQADPEIRSMSLARTGQGWELRIRFVAWSPGSSSLPKMEARGVAIPAIAYSATSSLGPGDNEISPPKPQLDPPGTALYLYGFAGFVIFLCLAVFGFAAYVFPAASRLLARRKAGEARRSLEKTIVWLGKALPESEPRAFYAALSRALRNYLAARVLPEAPSLTPRELSLLPPESFLDRAIQDEAVALLAEADVVRYAGAKSKESSMRVSLSRAAKLGDAAEEALDARL